MDVWVQTIFYITVTPIIEILHVHQNYSTYIYI